ncbi:hypothetical protein RMS29_012280 [Agrobacterium rosae]|uniref:Uncharacterized protein n=2 Tax=Agrobacterium rosae TaxID=1972867 RepID=A0ABU4VSV3_9HYPH|nr:hypothetical protein [Agrobacterium rosae]MCM2432538.1 hypothetical protein [Agrobacterium rosae]MDX8328391.1 hypothetical protein [Agrobacterium rosae]
MLHDMSSVAGQSNAAIPDMANGFARDDDDISILIRAAAVSTGQRIKKYYLFRIAAKTGGMAPPVA